MEENPNLSVAFAIVITKVRENGGDNIWMDIRAGILASAFFILPLLCRRRLQWKWPRP